MAEIKGTVVNLNDTVGPINAIDHFGSADVNGAASLTIAAGGAGTVVLEVSPGTNAADVTIWIPIRIFCDQAGVGAYQDNLVGGAGAQHGYAEIVGAKAVRARCSVNGAGCYVILNLKAA